MVSPITNGPAGTRATPCGPSEAVSRKKTLVQQRSGMSRTASHTMSLLVPAVTSKLTSPVKWVAGRV